MFSTLKTLVAGASARAEDQLRDTYAIEMIDQKIRDASAALKAAKYSLATLVQRERAEIRQVEALDTKIADLLTRAKAGLTDGREDLAQEAAGAVAQMENELNLRRETVQQLEARIMQLRQSVERGNRRIIDLKQGLVTAKAAKKEQGIQKRLGRHIAQDSTFEEAEELIAMVLKKGDPFEQAQILNKIDQDLSHSNMADKLAGAGFGPRSKSTPSDVLARLKS